jgi:hypothetical protein
VCLFARPVAQHFTTSYLGLGVDQPFFTWCLVWWPYALVHHLNPFVTKLIFAPAGLNLTWTTPIPLISLLAWPLTATLGPLAAYNLLCVFCPALAAWSAFLLCRYLTGAFWPSLLGGYVFGFSAYVLGHVLGGHPDCFSIFLLAPMVHVVLLRLDGRITRRAFELVFLALLVGQFLIADEFLATATVFGAAALAAGWAFGESKLRRRIEGLAGPISLAYLCAAVLMSPWLYYVFLDFRRSPVRASQEHCIDLLNLLLPTRTAGLSYASSFFADLSPRFPSNIAEQSGYVGLPLLIIAGWFALTRWRTLAGRILTMMLALSSVMALGPRLHIGGVATFELPWQMIDHVPLLNEAVPARVFVYATLVLTIVAAMWLSDARLHRRTRLVVAAVLLLSLLPNPWYRWAPLGDQSVVPRFFSSGLYRHYLVRGEIIAVPPSDWGADSEAMLWQAQTGMYFRLATGYLPFAPVSTFAWPIVSALMEQIALPDAAVQWTAFAASRRASVVMVPVGQRPPALDRMLEELGVMPLKVGGVLLYRMRPDELAKYNNASAAQMEGLENEHRFGQLALAAHAYLVNGADPALLAPNVAMKSGLPDLEWQPWGTGEPSLVLYAQDAGHIAVGVTGTYQGLVPLIERYGPFAQKLYFPFGHRLRGTVTVPMSRWPRRLCLVMVFEREGLRQVAALAMEGRRLEDGARQVRDTGRVVRGDF